MARGSKKNPSIRNTDLNREDMCILYVALNIYIKQLQIIGRPEDLEEVENVSALLKKFSLSVSDSTSEVK